MRSLLNYFPVIQQSVVCHICSIPTHSLAEIEIILSLVTDHMLQQSAVCLLHMFYYTITKLLNY